MSASLRKLEPVYQQDGASYVIGRRGAATLLREARRAGRLLVVGRAIDGRVTYRANGAMIFTRKPIVKYA